MKRFILLLTATLALATGAMAETLTVGNVSVGRGGKGRLNFGVSVTDASDSYYAFQMDITLPEGFTLKNKADGKPEVVYTDRMKDYFSAAASNYRTNEGYYSIAGVHSSRGGITVGTASEPIFYMTVVAGDSVPDGTYTGTVSGIIFTDKNDQDVDFDNATFTITVSGDYTGITLDEASTEALTATTEAADITVRRTINADEWSTLVLPFAMTGDELAAAFGSTAKLAEFAEWTPSDDSDDDGHPYSISMIFKDKPLADGLEANHPVLIRLDHAITSFSASDKTLDPEEEPAVTVNMTGSKKRADRADFVGSYTPLTIDEETLFISGDSFYYSTGKTRMNGFRGYFSVPDVVSAYYGNASSAKVGMVFTDETTGVITATNNRTAASSGVYNLAGQRVGDSLRGLPAGVYMANGRKTVIK